jgi:hypothetical protein
LFQRKYHQVLLSFIMFHKSIFKNYQNIFNIGLILKLPSLGTQIFKRFTNEISSSKSRYILNSRTQCNSVGEIKKNERKHGPVHGISLVRERLPFLHEILQYEFSLQDAVILELDRMPHCHVASVQIKHTVSVDLNEIKS